MLDISEDPEYKAYETLLKSDEWYSQYKGQYVAFLGGKLVDHDPDEHTLVGRVAELYADQSVFISQVDRYPPILNIPTAFFDL